MDVDSEGIRALMERIDACYAAGAEGDVLDLEEQLERRLSDLEHSLEALDEDEELLVDDGDPDGEVGVEEQFIALWHAYRSPGGSFGGESEASEAHLRDVLESACLAGMAPKGLRGDLPPLLPLARELARDRRALIERYRAHVRRWEGRDFGLRWLRPASSEAEAAVRREMKTPGAKRSSGSPSLIRRLPMDEIPRQHRHSHLAEAFQAALERARNRRLRRFVLAGSPEGGEVSAGVDWVDRVAPTDDRVGSVRRQPATDSRGVT